MKLNTRLSSLVTMALCAFTFLFAVASAPAATKKEKVVGTLKTEQNLTIQVNGKTAGDGASLRCGDVLETGNESVKVALASGQEYVIDAGTKVRLTCSPSGKVALLVIYGGVHPVGGDDGGFLEPLPWLAAFANSNSSFPSTGGGSQGTSGKVAIVSKGVLVGFALTDSLGRVVAFTDPSGKLLASFPPNGTPVSSVFGSGATIL